MDRSEMTELIVDAERECVRIMNMLGPRLMDDDAFASVVQRLIDASKELQEGGDA